MRLDDVVPFAVKSIPTKIDLFHLLCRDLATCVAPSTIGRNQERLGPGIEMFPFFPPPAPNRGHGKGTGIMIGPNIDEPGITPDIVNTKG